MERTIENSAIGDRVTFVETAAETGGARTVLELELAPGGRNGAHRHRAFAERFDVLEGRMVVHVDGHDAELAPGEGAEAAPGTTHFFANRTGAPARARVTLTPGHAGFERALRIAYGLARGGRTTGKGMPRNPLHLGVLTEESDSVPAGPAGVLGAPLALLARLARARGVDRELAQRYGA